MKTSFSKLFAVITCLWITSTSWNQLRAQDLTVKIASAATFYQSLKFVGTNPPSEQENGLLQACIDHIRKEGFRSAIPTLESFVSTRNDSPWAASIHANLGLYYRKHGRYTKALEHWQAAWNLTHTEKDGNGKLVADFTFAHWTKLLASLGRKVELKELFTETQGRVLDQGPLQQVVGGTMEGYRVMLTSPGISFKCGTYALRNVGIALKGAEFDSIEIDRIPSPAEGFSMSKLIELSDEAELNLVPVRWSDTKALVVPSVVHWKQNHYAAILEEKKGQYRVIDPTFGKPLWISGDDIRDEASGNFLIPKNKLSGDWMQLASTDTDKIHGMGFAESADDPTDGCGNGSGGGTGGGSDGGSSSGGPINMAMESTTTGGGSCRTCGGGLAGAGGAGATGGGGGSCCGGGSGGSGSGNPSLPAGSSPPYVAVTGGMPIWEVSEPYINLWLHDEPLGYQPGFGGRVSFKLSYKQRDSKLIYDEFFSFGPLWNCSWSSVVTYEAELDPPIVYVASGGERTVSDDGTTKDYYSQSTMAPMNNNREEGFYISYPNGDVDHYDFVVTNLFGLNHAFLTRKYEPSGHYMQFIYARTNDFVWLKYVVDTDGRTNTLTYTNSTFPTRITGVEDPFGRKAFMEYNNAGILTNIIDVAALGSSFNYDSRGWITNLTTPYGATTFLHVTNSDTYTDEFGQYGSGLNPYVATRTLKVIDAVSGTNIYMLRQDSSVIYTNSADYYTDQSNGVYIDPLFNVYDDGNYLVFLPYQFTYPYDYATVPYGAPSPNTLDNNYLYYRNSFHWGPKQAVGLPENLVTLIPSDYKKARMRHWLHKGIYPAVGAPVSQTLDLEQAPSSDGITDGQTTWYDYDGKAYPLAEGTSSLPSLVARVNPDGTPQGTTWYQWFQRDEWGRATNVVETYSTSFGETPLTRTNQYVYSGSDLVQHIGPEGHVEHGYFYNGAHQILRHTNAVNEVTYHTYDAAGRLTSTKTPAGLTTTNIYPASGSYSNWVEKIVDLEIGRTNSFTYTNNLVFTHTDERGLTVTNTWDALQHLRKVSYPDGTFITNSYDKLDLVRRVDRMGYTNSFGYDAVRRLVAQTNALGRYTLYDRCSCGSLNSIRDAGGNFTYFFYDNQGKVVNTVYPDGYSVTNHYNLIGQVTNTVDSAGASTTNWFNNQGLLVTASNAFGQLFTRIHDLEDRVTNSVDAAGVTIVTTYDDLGRPRTRTYPDSGVESFGYSARGLIAYTNQLSHTNFYAYDEARRKTFETNANWEVTQFKYDVSGNLTNLVDGKNQNTFWKYDEYSRVTNKLDHLLTNIFVYKYDPNNRLTNRWTPAKADTKYKYDPAGNLTNVDYTVSPDITLKYDALNRLTNMMDAVGATKYGYNAVGQLLSEDGPWSDDAVSYSYANRLRQSASVVTPNAAAWTVNYAYDSMKRLTNITSPAGSFDYQYFDNQPSTLIHQLTLPTGSYITNDYDNVSRQLFTRLVRSDDSVLNEHEYAYNAGNQRTNQTRVNLVFTNGPAYLATNSVAYGYDKIGQLLAADGREAGTTLRLSEQFAYTYDKAGNLSNRVQNLFTNTFNVNSLNELTTVTRAGALTVAGNTLGRVTNVTVNTLSALLYEDATFARTNMSLSDGNNTFTAIAKDSFGRTATNASTTYLPATLTCVYDLNGNLRTNGNRVLEYDDENQLTAVTVSNAWRSEFVYDGKMRRRIRKEYTWQSSAWVKTNEVRYVYDGNLVIQERNTNNVVAVTYTRGKDLSGSMEGAGGIGGLLARSANIRLLFPETPDYTHAYYHSDGNGNVTCLINTNEIIVAKYVYDPFGNTLSASGPLADANLYRFSSKELHANSGLVYYLYRHYAAGLQRWLNRDPLGDSTRVRQLWPSGTKLVSRMILFRSPFESIKRPNLFQFVENNPLTDTDPWGLHSAADCEREKENCDDGCRSMPTGTSWERFLRRSCWAGCMTAYAACLGTTDTALVCVAVGVVIVGGIIVAPTVTLPVLIAL